VTIRDRIAQLAGEYVWLTMIASNKEFKGIIKNVDMESDTVLLVDDAFEGLVLMDLVSGVENKRK